jgi:DNA-binding transcriptional LysR family regulator
MNLNSNYIQAFYEVAKTGSFSKAAENLFITQSAVSQRIRSLENDLETSLIIRDRASISLTETGNKLLDYAKNLSNLENEFMGKLTDEQGLNGVIKICAYSSILRSIIIPKLSKLLRDNPNVQIQFISQEMDNIPAFLKSARADFIILDYHLNKDSLIETVIDLEEYVVIESIKYNCPKDIYLDHGPNDNATESFFKAQGKKEFKLRRTFMGDVYGILDGVKQGFGRAVMSKHLVDKNFKIIKGYKKYKRDITLHYQKSLFYTELQKAVINELSL